MPDIPLDGIIDKERVDWVLSQLKPGDRLVINSPGGRLSEAFRLSEHVRKNNINTHVNATGIAHSSAVLVFSAGVKRTAGGNAQFMLHPATGEGADAGTPFLLNNMLRYGTKGSPDFLKVTKGDWVFDWDTARGINLITDDKE